jgi:hypothetical protein
MATDKEAIRKILNDCETNNYSAIYIDKIDEEKNYFQITFFKLEENPERIKKNKGEKGVF